MAYLDRSRSHPTPFGMLPAAAAMLRCLAVVDAVALQSLLVWWFWSWPKHGSLFGAVLSALVAWWAIKRVARVVFDYGNYRWLAWRLFKLLVVAWLIKGAVFLAS